MVDNDKTCYLLSLAEYLSILIDLSLSHAAERLLKEGDKIHREQKLWNDVKNIFEDICKKATVPLSGPSKRFISYIGHGNVDMLEGFPDSWSCNKKATYLFSIISTDSSEVRLALQKLKFGWPKGTTGEIHQVLRKVIDHEKGKKNPKTYDEEDGYDYLRLCRNIVKHWKSISKSVSYLQVLENIIYGSQLSYQISNSVLYQLNCNAAMLSQCGGFSPDDGEMDSKFMVPNI